MQAAKQTILLIDDDRDLRETLADGLEAAGYAVIQDDGIRNVMRTLSSLKVSVVIIDLVLTGDSGATMLGYLKAHPLLRNTKSIMMSGFDHAEKTAQLWGADKFLLKPVTIAQLIEAVKQLSAPPGDRP